MVLLRRDMFADLRLTLPQRDMADCERDYAAQTFLKKVFKAGFWRDAGALALPLSPV